MKKTNKTSVKSQYTRASIVSLATAIASNLKPGDIITLDGPLGSGKTTLTQALSQALGVNETVTSPSFGLINEYTTGKYPIAHIDLYRLGPEKAYQIWDELNLFLEEARHIMVIEWACYGSGLPIDLYDEASAEIHLEYLPNHPETRELTINSTFPITIL
jgi:tRNA threonylcarbamoyladenosine biosynthesis protein TsaE